MSRLLDLQSPAWWGLLPPIQFQPMPYTRNASSTHPSRDWMTSGLRTVQVLCWEFLPKSISRISKRTLVKAALWEGSRELLEEVFYVWNKCPPSDFLSMAFIPLKKDKQKKNKTKIGWSVQTVKVMSAHRILGLRLSSFLFHCGPEAPGSWGRSAENDVLGTRGMY